MGNDEMPSVISDTLEAPCLPHSTCAANPSVSHHGVFITRISLSLPVSVETWLVGHDVRDFIFFQL